MRKVTVMGAELTSKRRNGEHHGCYMCVNICFLKSLRPRYIPMFGNREEDNIWENTTLPRTLENLRHL